MQKVCEEAGSQINGQWDHMTPHPSNHNLDILFASNDDDHKDDEDGNGNGIGMGDEGGKFDLGNEDGEKDDDLDGIDNDWITRQQRKGRAHASRRCFALG